jgi:hypothetical protein
MAKRKMATAAQLADWRIGHHVEAAGKMIAAALNRIADQMEADHALKAAEVDLRREHLLHVLESKAMADRAAQRLMGLIPDGGFVDLRGRTTHDLRDAAEASERKGPDWLKDVLADADAQTEKL